MTHGVSSIGTSGFYNQIYNLTRFDPLGLESCVKKTALTSIENSTESIEPRGGCEDGINGGVIAGGISGAVVRGTNGGDGADGINGGIDDEGINGGELTEGINGGELTEGINGGLAEGINEG